MDSLAARERLHQIVFAGVLISLLYLPFLNKPVHIDDTSFLTIGEGINLLGLSVSAVHTYFSGNETYMSPFISVHPVVVPFYLHLVHAVTGSSAEYVYHIAFLLFPVILLTGLIGICRELDMPLVPMSLFVMGNIAFLPVSHNLMADGPTFALLVLSFYFFLRSVRGLGRLPMAISSILMILATLASYYSMFISLLFVGYAALRLRRQRILLLLAALPVIVCGVMLLFVISTTPFSLRGLWFESTRAMVGKRRIYLKYLSIVANLGAMTLFLNPLYLIVRGRICLPKRTGFVLLFSVVIGTLAVYVVRYPLGASLWLIILVASGIFFTLMATVNALMAEKGSEGRSVQLFLVTWLYVVVLYNAVMMPMAALRYQLAALIPAVLLPLMILYKGRMVFAAAVLTALLGITVACGDYIFATAYRDLPARIERQVGSARERIWFIGEWGMKYYMRKSGFRYLTEKSNEPSEGDLIFISTLQKIWEPSPALFQRMTLIDEVDIDSSYPVRVMGVDFRAGYYSDHWGLLPFTLSTRPVERIGVFRVARPY